ncbi:alkaline phosphatase D family protein [Aeromicrobium sp. CF4.19]|uniref:alkaline phosphatase D family protein n=1 Tax=Aeromicrobium sp. CF4.19 TaxID=3373082 RepID=UPI003EE70E3A
MDSARAVLDRRHVVLGGLGIAVGLGAVASVAMPSPAPASRHHSFQHGLASGDPLPHAVVLWTRVTPTPQAEPGTGVGESVVVEWEVSRSEDFAIVDVGGRERTGIERDHTVKVDADGLQPDTSYWYRFRHGRDMITGRTRTAPATDAEPQRLRLGIVSCANWQAGHFSAYRHLRSHDLDAVVHLGDYLYEYEPGMYSYGPDWEDVRRHDPPRETVSLHDYRRRHAQYKTDPDLRELHADLPMIVTWDDHEVADGWHPAGAFEHQSATEGPWLERRQAAIRAYDEWMPVRLGGTVEVGDGERIHRSFRFGRLAELAMLDLRGHRDERVEPDDPATHDEGRTMTGSAQDGWLADALLGSPARWKLVGNPVMMAPMLMPPRPRGQELAVKATTDPMTWGAATPNSDTWDGYPAQRRRLLERIADAEVADVLFLSGDVHTAWGNEIELGGRPVATELVCSAVTSNNVDDYMGTAARTVSLAMEQAIQTVNPHAKFVNLDDHGFSIVELTATQARLEWWAVDDRRDPDSGAHLLTSRRVHSGQARMLPG